MKNEILDLLCDLAGSVFYSLSIYTFAKMADFAPGGLSGLALIMNHLWRVPIGLTTLILNIPVVVLSCRIIGRKFLLKTARSMIFCTFFLDVVFPHTPMYEGVPFLAALYSGACLGMGLSLFYIRGSSSGGTDFLTMSIKALRPHLSIGFVTMSIDLLIISLGGVVFGNIDAVLYGLVSTFTASTVIDKVMYGLGSGILSIIITDYGQQVSEKISQVSDRGSTLIDARGAYTGHCRDVLLCACSKAEAHVIRKAVREMDENAFVMLVETSQVYGLGFIEKGDEA